VLTLHSDFASIDPAPPTEESEGSIENLEKALLEIAFVFGQLSHPASIPALTAALSNLQEASMVRHEAAEALGSLGEEDGVEDTLKKFLDDKEQVVRESVIVALDMAEFEKGGEIEYALIPETA
jgi:deoxyhypusine monooxygenase